MQYAVIKKDRIESFISKLAQEMKVAAPVPKGYGQYAFEFVTSGKDVVSGKYIPTILPPKKYFMPQRESLLEYNTAEGQKMEAVVEYDKMAIFGAHTCDLAGIQCLNMTLSERPRDINYLVRKNKIAIIGLECLEYCDEYASCALVDNDLPNGGYDLFMTDIGDSFIVHVNTQAGEDLLEKTKVFEPAKKEDVAMLDAVREKKRKIFRNEVPIEHDDIPALFDASYDSKVWEELDKKCVGCSSCTNVCPTCYCFDVIDEPNLDLKTGKRYRQWDSCQSEPFAEVAGGENFRKSRAMRQRHRFYRKFKYQHDKFSRFHCTGCGRCSRTCMAKIDLKETLNKLIAENKGAK